MGTMLRIRDSGGARGHHDGDPKRTYSGRQIVFLVLGAALIIGVTGFTLTRLNDRTVFTVLVPGAVAGLVLIVLGVLAGSGQNGRAGHGGYV
jgi:hypothetical protein